MMEKCLLFRGLDEFQLDSPLTPRSVEYSGLRLVNNDVGGDDDEKGRDGGICS